MQGTTNLFSKTGEGRDVGSGSHSRVRDEGDGVPVLNVGAAGQHLPVAASAFGFGA
jgi:hypothetical protein